MPFNLGFSELAFFVIAVIIIFLFLSSAKIFKKSKKLTSRDIVLLIITCALVLTIILTFSNIEMLNKLPEKAQLIFISQYSLFAWLCVPIVIMALLKEKDKKK